MNKPLEIYCQVILHSGCAITREKHTWDDCPDQKFYRRIARKRQHKLKSNGVAIGVWIDERKYRIEAK